MSVVMVSIAIVLTIVSLAGPDWVSASFYEGDVKSWGLWWDCLKVHASFEMCLSAGKLINQIHSLLYLFSYFICFQVVS